MNVRNSGGNILQDARLRSRREVLTPKLTKTFYLVFSSSVSFLGVCSNVV